MSYNEQFATSIIAADSVMLLDNKTPLGLSFIQSALNDIPETVDSAGEPLKIGSFSDTYRILTATWGTLYSGIAWGCNIKYLSREISKYAAEGYALDLGMQTFLTDQVSFGLAYRNLLSDIIWSTGTSEVLEKRLAVGLSVLDTFGDLPVIINADYGLPLANDSSYWAIGTELWLMPKIFALRLGTNSEKDITT